MKTQSIPQRWVAALFFILVFIGISSITANQAQSPEVAKESFIVAQVGLDLTDDQRRAEALIQTLPLEEVLGSLAPVALSPFFALTCLSGVSLLSSSGMLPDGIADNFIMGANSPLNDENVFIGLLVLTLITAAPRLTKVSKPFAQAVDQVEAFSGIIAAIAVQVLSSIGSSEVASPEVALYQAGFITATYSSFVSMLIIAFSAINIFVVNSVKFFFEIMILISPFPTVDAIFEAANKAFTAFLIGIYIFNPWAATFLNLLIFLVSLMIFAWTYRRIVFMRCVLSDPFFGWLGDAILGRKLGIKSTKLPRSVSEEHPEYTVSLKAFTGRKEGGLKKKTKGYFVQSGGASYFVKPNLFRKDKVLSLSETGRFQEIRKGLFSHSIVFTDSTGEVSQKIMITKRYQSLSDQIHRAITTRESSGDSFSKTEMPDFGRSIRKADAQDLRSEMS